MGKRIDSYNAHYFAKRLRERMDQRGITQSELANATGIQRQSISSYLRAGTIPSADKLVALACELNCSSDFLLGLDDYPEKESGRYTVQDIGFSAEAAHKMYGQDSIAHAINLLIGTEHFSMLLKSLCGYYYSCEANCVNQDAILSWRVNNGGGFPANKKIAELLGEIALDEKLAHETQCKLFVLSERYERAEEVTIFANYDEDNLFLNKLCMKDMYELHANKYVNLLADELEKKAVSHIRSLSLLCDEISED